MENPLNIHLVDLALYHFVQLNKIKTFLLLRENPPIEKRCVCVIFCVHNAYIVHYVPIVIVLVLASSETLKTKTTISYLITVEVINCNIVFTA